MNFLLKIGQSKYIHDMYDNEYLFFNTYTRFRKKEKDLSGRNDPREANTKNQQLTSLKVLTPKGKEIILSEDFEKFNGQYNEFPTVIPNNICSFSTLNIGENLKLNEIDERILSLGDKTLIIYHLDQFFKIIDKSLEEQKIEFSRRLVKYYNYRTYNGPLTFHHKNDLYKYQNEYRILLQTPGTNTIKLNIPGLKKISLVIDTGKLKSIKLKMI